MWLSYEEGDWVETAVQLAVRKPDVTSSPASEVTQGLPASLAVYERCPGGVNEQLLKLLEQIEPYSAEISTLVAQGYEVSIRVTGFVGNGSSFSLTPDVIARVAALNVPLTAHPSTSDR
ncbi:DUF4279 domain-containing protein [Streptomyces mutabilis]|uniref:DUF4279 domain-containing protein n=1 Tax=Streptomyces mutabilis TaxID=67332 RepID=UPI0033BF83EF